MSGRTQKDRVNGVEGSSAEIKYGVPQGSVLEDILFIVYINNLCNRTFKGEITVSTDNTAFLYKADSIAELFSQISEDLRYLQLWFSKTFLVISEVKTNYILFHFKKNKKYMLENVVYYYTECSNNNLNGCLCPKIIRLNNVRY